MVRVRFLGPTLGPSLVCFFWVGFSGPSPTLLGGVIWIGIGFTNTLIDGYKFICFEINSKVRKYQKMDKNGEEET